MLAAHIFWRNTNWFRLSFVVILAACSGLGGNVCAVDPDDYWRRPVSGDTDDEFFLPTESKRHSTCVMSIAKGPIELHAFGPSILHPAPPRFTPTDSVDLYAESETQHFLDVTSPLRQATMLQPTPFLQPEVTLAESPPLGGTLAGGRSSIFDDPRLDRSFLRTAGLGNESLSVDLVSGEESGTLVTTDAGSLLRKSKSSLGTQVQARTPVVNDPRVRSSRIGALAASGSHWVPARADIDTALSKIDSRLLSDVIVIPGPYSSLYGPGFHFIDFELLPSPRNSNGNEIHGRTSFNHQSNGNQWLGQQSLWAGGNDWGLRSSYTHRYGNNYRDGDGNAVASGYESRTFTVSYGRDLSDRRSVEFSLLRLDQTDVQFPGFVFDIDVLVTDGYEITFVDDAAWLGDRSETEIWYNRTAFDGDSRNPNKTRQFPFLTFVDFDGRTDAEVMSTGYRRALSWGASSEPWRFTLGHDLRMVKQEVNEVFSTLFPGDANRVSGQSPLPRSFSVNPGMFAEYSENFCDCFTFQSGTRVDFVQTDITDDPRSLQAIGLNQRTYADTVGTGVSQTDRWLWSLYGKVTREHSQYLTSSLSLGYAQRPPTLTELYGAEQLLLAVQNGLNALTGDPRLKSEKLLQLDLSVDYENNLIKGGVRGFSGWAFDYITFENTFVRNFNSEIVQTSLRYVNTDLATLSGFESYLELLHQSRLSLFATLRYVEGRDRTRTGKFATRQADQLFASGRVSGLPRGFFSGIAGEDAEPLPGISPLESRIGARLRDSAAGSQWDFELSARIVDNQDRVASSLLEFQTPGFTTWDARAVWRPERWAGFSMVAGCENFTDKTYREHLDFRSRAGANVLQPGANFYVGADLTY